jgi:hypothetical protein
MILSHILLSRLTQYTKLLGIIKVEFDLITQILIQYSVLIKFWWKSRSKIGLSQLCINVGVDGRIILKLISKKQNVRMWIILICFWIGSSAGSWEQSNELLDSIKDSGIYWLAEWLLASQDGLCSMELINYLILKSERWKSHTLNIYN